MLNSSLIRFWDFVSGQWGESHFLYKRSFTWQSGEEAKFPSAPNPLSRTRQNQPKQFAVTVTTALLPSDVAERGMWNIFTEVSRWWFSHDTHRRSGHLSQFVHFTDNQQQVAEVGILEKSQGLVHFLSNTELNIRLDSQIHEAKHKKGQFWI